MREAYVIDAIRTPRGRRSQPKHEFVGELANTHPATLGATLVNALLERNPTLPPEKVEDIFYSVVLAEKEQSANMARTVVLSSNLPVTSSVEVKGLTSDLTGAIPKMSSFETT